jgi:hypothetical protein
MKDYELKMRDIHWILVYTWLSGGLEHLKIETRLIIDERFESVMGECVI